MITEEIIEETQGIATIIVVAEVLYMPLNQEISNTIALIKREQYLTPCYHV